MKIADEIKTKVAELIEAAIAQGRDEERARIADALAGITTPEPVTGTARYKNGTAARFTATLRAPKSTSKFLEAPITRTRRLGRNGVGKRAYDARKAHLDSLSPGAVIRSKDLAKLSPKVSSYTDHQIIARLLTEKVISTTPTRGSYIKNQ